MKIENSPIGKNNRITIIAGHYGCGKTNVAVNLAKGIAASGKKVSIVDLDIVNPYFRTADSKKMLSDLGVDTILPEFANTNVDIPTLPARFRSVFVSDNAAVIDVGGDDGGAVVLAGFCDELREATYSMYFVYNKYRPSIANTLDAYGMLLAIESASKLKFGGIINNSNLGGETEAQDVLASLADADRLSMLSGLPVVATTAHKRLENTLCKHGEFVFIDDITKKLF